jgi:hypothetical protein
MTSIREIDNTLPSYYTLSNKNLIIIAHVRDETIYFYNELGEHTTIILLAEPSCYYLKKVFLDFMNDLGVTVIDVREKETFDSNYKISDRSIGIICKMISQYNYKKIITHPKYAYDNDPQNRAIYDVVSQFMDQIGHNNHYTYNMHKEGKKKDICGIQKGIIELYSIEPHMKNRINKRVYDNYISISGNMNGTKKLK